MEPRAHDLILQCKTVKDMWIYLDNLSRAYDVIQELFKSEQESRTLVQFYVDFTNFLRRSRSFFPITAHVKEMQKRWNKFMVLVSLGDCVQSF